MDYRDTFTLGKIVATADVLTLCGATHIDFGLLFDRHRSGDWGNVTCAVRRRNNLAVHTKGMLTSVYDFPHYQIRIVTGNLHRFTTISLLDIDA